MKRVLPWIFATSLVALGGTAHAFPQSDHPAMTDPSKAKEKAPETFRAKFETTQGNIVFDCTRDWAPNGVDRFYNLVKIGFFDDIAFFRVVHSFVVQWGIHGDPAVSRVWSDANLPPDPPKQSNTRGMLTYAMAGRPDTRSTQLFVNYKDNSNLDGMGFAPLCKVSEGMEVADKLFGEYGEAVTSKQGEITAEGNAYLHSKWPKLDYVKTATIMGEPLAPGRKPKAEGPAGASSASAGGGEGKTGEGDSGDKIVLGAVVAILVAGGALLYFTRKNDEPTPAAKKPAPKGDDPPAKKKKAKTDDAPAKKANDDEDEASNDEAAKSDDADAEPAPVSKKKKKPKAD